MNRSDRGEITEIKMNIRYPDGSSKEVTYDEKWVQETGAILVHENCMNEEQRQTFKGGDNWKNNATFLKWERFSSSKCHPDTCPGGGSCRECCSCTSCKK